MERPIYLDYQSTTPTDKRILAEMLPYFSEKFGNPASKQHVFGWIAEDAVEKARLQVAKLIDAKPEEIVFTSGATESNNLSLKGIVEMYSGKGNHIITAATEHKSVLDPCEHLKRLGSVITVLPVDAQGFVDPNELIKSITDRTILVSIMHANNEIGTIQNIETIGKICREKGIIFHSDATQSVGKIAFSVQRIPLDLASFSAHKIYGPKGIGALFIRSGKPRVNISAQIEGGGHERNRRSGTLNVPAIVGFGKAAEICMNEGVAESNRIENLRDAFWKTLLERLDNISLNGHPIKRLPGNLNICCRHVRADQIMTKVREIAIASGSACSSAFPGPSHVLQAICLPKDMIDSSIRISFGRYTTEEESMRAADLIISAVIDLREKSSAYEIIRKRRK